MPDEALKNAHLGMIGRRMSQPHTRIDPFPELSNSSEEDVGMRSAASSFSSTRSSSSSRSSLSRSDNNSLKNSFIFGGTQLEPDSYVERQQVNMRGSGSHGHSSSKMKPNRVASFISEEPNETSQHRSDRKDRKSKTKKAERNVEVGSSYVEMTPTTKSGDKMSIKLVNSQPLPQPPQMVMSQQSLPSKPLTQPTKLSVPTSKHVSATSIKQPTQTTKRVSSQPSGYQKQPLPSQPNQQILPSKPQHQPKSPSAAPQPSSKSDKVASVKSSHSFELSKPPPLTCALPVPTNDTPIDTAGYASMAPLAKEDPYAIMNMTGNEISDEKQLVVDLSDTSTIASSEITLPTVSTGTGSSGDSNHTLQFEELLHEEKKPTLANTQYSVHSKVRHILQYVTKNRV